MVYSLDDLIPKLAQGAWVAENATVIGDVSLGENASVWFGSILRGDINAIRIGKDTNIQDLSLCHVADDYPCIIGERCVVGHNVMLHGCVIEDEVLVGIGAIVLNGAHIGRGSIVAAGSLVPEGKSFPHRSLIMGAPATVKRETTDAEYELTLHLSQKYVTVKQRYTPAAFRLHPYS